MQTTNYVPTAQDKLYQSVNWGLFSEASELLNRPDVDINHYDLNGDTALMCAVRPMVKNYDLIALLLSRPDVDVDAKNNWGHTAYDQAYDDIKERFPNLKP